MLDKHGMPVPHQSSPIPWQRRFDGMQDVNDEWVIEGGFLSQADVNFTLHAVNNIKSCERVINQLLELIPEITPLAHEGLDRLVRDAQTLWDQMLSDAKANDGVEH